MAGIQIAIPRTLPRSSRTNLRVAWRWFFRRFLLMFSITILLLLSVTAIFAPLIAPHHATKGDLDDKNLPPFWMSSITVDKIVVDGFAENDLTEISLQRAASLSASRRVLTLDGGTLERDDVVPGMMVQEVIRPAGTSKFLLGTDPQGRDLLSRIVWGARISLVVAGLTLAVGGTIGVVLGLISGYYGGVVDEIIMRVVDIMLALPLVLVALVVVVAVGEVRIPLLPQKEVHLLAGVISLFIWVSFARQTRGETLRLKTMDYIALARVSGCSTLRIMVVHILPGALNTIVVVATLQVSTVILLEASLSFLGAGVPPPTPAWGSMVAGGRDFLKTAWWVSTMPGLALLLTVLAFNVLGDWLRDALDPRLRQIG